MQRLKREVHATGRACGMQRLKAQIPTESQGNMERRGPPHILRGGRREREGRATRRACGMQRLNIPIASRGKTERREPPHFPRGGGGEPPHHLRGGGRERGGHTARRACGLQRLKAQIPTKSQGNMERRGPPHILRGGRGKPPHSLRGGGGEPPHYLRKQRGGSSRHRVRGDRSRESPLELTLSSVAEHGVEANRSGGWGHRGAWRRAGNVRAIIVTVFLVR